MRWRSEREPPKNGMAVCSSTKDLHGLVQNFSGIYPCCHSWLNPQGFPPGIIVIHKGFQVSGQRIWFSLVWVHLPCLCPKNLILSWPTRWKYPLRTSSQVLSLGRWDPERLCNLSQPAKEALSLRPHCLYFYLFFSKQTLKSCHKLLSVVSYWDLGPWLWLLASLKW